MNDPMICGECRRPCAWNPAGWCSWKCFDTAPRAGAPEAFAYFLGLGAPDRVDGHG